MRSKCLVLLSRPTHGGGDYCEWRKLWMLPDDMPAALSVGFGFQSLEMKSVNADAIPDQADRVVLLLNGTEMYSGELQKQVYVTLARLCDCPAMKERAFLVARHNWVPWVGASGRVVVASYSRTDGQTYGELRRLASDKQGEFENAFDAVWTRLQSGAAGRSRCLVSHRLVALFGSVDIDLQAAYEQGRATKGNDLPSALTEALDGLRGVAWNERFDLVKDAVRAALRPFYALPKDDGSTEAAKQRKEIDASLADEVSDVTSGWDRVLGLLESVSKGDLTALYGLKPGQERLLATWMQGLEDRLSERLKELADPPQ